MKTLANSVLARVEQQRELMEALNADTTAIRVRVSSPDKSVSVEVDGVGALTGLWLTAGIQKYSGSALSALIVETAQHAARASLQRRNQLIQEFSARMEQAQDSGLEGWDGTVVHPDRPKTELPQPQPQPSQDTQVNPK